MKLEKDLEVRVTDEYGHSDDSLGAILTNQKKLEFAQNLKKQNERIKEKYESEAVHLHLEKTLRSFFLNSHIRFQRFSVFQETHGLYRTTSIVIHLTEDIHQVQVPQVQNPVPVSK